MYYMNISDAVGSNGFRFGDRSDPINLNSCAGCVTMARAVPEPGVVALLVTGLAGLWLTAAAGRRRAARHAPQS